MAATATSAMMATASATATSTASSGMSGMSGMDMSGSSGSSDTMSMNMWLTTSYKHSPVIFKQLRATSAAGAFGIFCVLFFSAFAFRGLMFFSSYLEQAVFHNYSNTIIVEEDNCACDGEDDLSSDPEAKPHQSTTGLGPGQSPIPVIQMSFFQIVKKMVFLTPTEMFQDFIRLLVALVIVIFGYALMLAAMSFVLTYFFAICLGLAFGEIFFNRLSIVLDINKTFGACAGLH